MPDDQDRNRSDRDQDRDPRRDAAAQDGRSSSGAPEQPLDEREYRDAKGEEHHHTNTYMEQHEGDRR